MARKLRIHSWQNEKNYSHQINYMYVVQLSKKNLKKKKSCQNIYVFAFGISTRVSAWRDPIFFAKNIFSIKIPLFPHINVQCTLSENTHSTMMLVFYTEQHYLLTYFS